MLGFTHLVTGSLIGHFSKNPKQAIVLGLASHILLDSIGHDDVSISAKGQVLLGATALGALALNYGTLNSTIIGGISAAVPDAEVGFALLISKTKSPKYLFPSHWQIGSRKGEHPVQLGKRLPMKYEILLSMVGFVTLLALKPRS